MTQKPGAVIIEGHVQGLSNTRSLGKAGIPVYVVDKTDCIAQYSKYCLKFFRSPDFQTDSFADFLISLAISEKLNDWVLIPSNDHAVYTLSKHKKRLENYYHVITPEIKIINRIYDKIKLIEVAEANNVPVPITHSLKPGLSIVKDIAFFPVLIKGRNGLTFYKALGKKVFIAKDTDELKSQLQDIQEKFDIENVFLQEMIPLTGENKTVSFTAFCQNGKIISYWTGVKLREHPLTFGTATYAMNTEVPDCKRHSEKILKALKYTGACEIEYIRDPRTAEYKLIEMNPRTWLWVELARASGIDYAMMIYNHANGFQLQHKLADNKICYWKNPVTDLLFSIQSILTFRLNPFLYISSLFRKNTVDPLFQKGDMMPAMMYLRSIFKYRSTR